MTSTFHRIVQGCHGFEGYVTAINILARSSWPLATKLWSRCFLNLAARVPDFVIWSVPSLTMRGSSIGGARIFLRFPWLAGDKLRVPVMHHMNFFLVHQRGVVFVLWIELRPGSLVVVVRLQSCRRFQISGIVVVIESFFRCCAQHRLRSDGRRIVLALVAQEHSRNVQRMRLRGGVCSAIVGLSLHEEMMS